MVVKFRPITVFEGRWRCLSNFHGFHEIILDGASYPTLEHAFQASKTLDPELREAIRRVSTPGRAKGLGRKVPLRPDWDAIKIDVMRELLRQKFSYPDLAEALDATGNAELIEGNWWGDRFWGQCPVGVGENWLGRLLMEIREANRAAR